MRTVRDLTHYRQTIDVIFRKARVYSGDMIRFRFYSPDRFYYFVLGLPYVADPKEIETISRPLLLINREYGPRDCDDKTLLVAAWCELTGRSYRVVVVQGPGYSHVYPEIFTGARWLVFDATYPDRNQLGARLYDEKATATNREVFHPRNKPAHP